ncbi:hypothetical protein [Micromonospora rubida]|uniref:hypothetical protein n=1 Tax=Micromonospora rubida TaxID=2697657 RepID=UPI001376C546|nr:hypothetical protein [Micromonospora rubida]NBE84832.1 hypothetical protein [Micromonospora rubida]
MTATMTIATTMRRRNSARVSPRAARLANTKLSNEVAATMMPRTWAWGLTRPGATAEKVMIAATVSVLRLT